MSIHRRPAHTLSIAALIAVASVADAAGVIDRGQNTLQRNVESGPGTGAAPAPTQSQLSLTLAGANQILEAAITEARRLSAGGSIAVVDAGGALIAFQRLDGTFAAGAEVSIGKARTAAVFKKPTRAFEEAINGGRIALTAVQQMTPLQGGVPVLLNGAVVGAIGVSGAHSQQEDEQIAIAGAAAIISGSDDATTAGHRLHPTRTRHTPRTIP